MHPTGRSLPPAKREHGSSYEPRGPFDTQPETSHGLCAERASQSTLRPGVVETAAHDGTDISFVGRTENQSVQSHISRYFLTEIDRKHADIILIACGFVGGLVDGLSFNAWGSFSSMQTGKRMHCTPAS
jgi:hypothetical protein